ncbi:SH3 domain-containing protein [Moraxella marmotae]|uniref:SH3 domain-containing protein n=1 Tax=Moraxella marmotae TaxID=3344520 RepID=UPI0035F2575C
MKKMLILSGAIVGATMLTACDDIAKGVAREILKDEAPAQQAPAAQPQVQNLQPVIVDGQAQQPVQQQYDQNGQPVAQQPVQQVPVQQAPVQQAPAPVQQAPVQAAPPPKAAPRPAVSERVVRKRAYVLTQHGSNVMVRSAPNRNARKIGYLYDTEEIWVVGETSNCHTVNGLYGCWVKVVDSNGLTGYSFDAYLQY